jgi:glycosyltransferase involved in cell wall biosynthesis
VVFTDVSNVVCKIYGLMMSNDKKRILYISMTGMGEPLGQSQVLEYLFIIARTYDVTIVSSEKSSHNKKESALAATIAHYNIQWNHINYSNKFGVLSSIYQLIRLFFAAFIKVIQDRPDIIHARSFIPTIVAVILHSFIRVKIVFDIRGFFLEEKIDTGRLIKATILHKLLKKVERVLYKRSDSIVSLTMRGKEIIRREYDIPLELITVIPTCVNTNLFRYSPQSEKKKLRQKLELPDKKIVIHHGAVEGWYDFESEVRLFKAMYDRDKDIYLLILNKTQHDYILKVLQKNGINDNVYKIKGVEFYETNQYLNASDVSMFFIRPTYSKQASQPTKFAENTACHLFTVTTKDVGDMDYYAETYKTALLIDWHKLSGTLETLATNILSIINNDSKLPSHYAYERLLQECFSNEIAVDRYMTVYRQLLS